jgi:hypothetical protein
MSSQGKDSFVQFISFQDMVGTVRSTYDLLYTVSSGLFPLDQVRTS